MNWKLFVWRAIGGGLAIFAMHFYAGEHHMQGAFVPFATSCWCSDRRMRRPRNRAR
jgi:hypothetical protein